MIQRHAEEQTGSSSNAYRVSETTNAPVGKINRLAKRMVECRKRQKRMVYRLAMMTMMLTRVNVVVFARCEK